MNSTPSYGVHRIMGAETEYGVIAPSAPGTNPTVLSALVVNTYAKLAFRRGEAFREQLQRRVLAAELVAEVPARPRTTRPNPTPPLHPRASGWGSPSRPCATPSAGCRTPPPRTRAR